MRVETVKVTIGQIADAIEKNGLPQAFGDFVTYRYEKAVAGCAIGQAGINLGVEPALLDEFYYKWLIGRYGNLVKVPHEYNLVSMNDNDKMPLPEIAAILRNVAQRDQTINEEIEVETIG